jgi:uncharacterized protein YbjQ (UPF0145 family)
VSPRNSPDSVTVSTTDTIPGMDIDTTLGIVTAEWVGGVNIFRDFFAGVRNIVGGRSAALEKELRSGRDNVLQELRTRAAELGADAVVGIRFDSSPLTGGSGGGMLMIGAIGTAVRLRSRPASSSSGYRA